VTSPMEILAPRVERSFAQERPIPEAPPVMAIVFPAKEGREDDILLGLGWGYFEEDGKWRI